MIPPVVQEAKKSAALVALLGSPFRFYAFGDAGQGVEPPYATYQIIGGSPENFLSNRPDADSFMIQIDCWDKTELGVINLATLMRYALETVCHITDYGPQGRDATTRNYRVTFTLDYKLKR